jgi:hypothetical protein
MHRQGQDRMELYLHSTTRLRGVVSKHNKYSTLKLKAQELKEPTNKTPFSCMLTVTVGIIFRV